MNSQPPLDLTFAHKLIQHSVWETGRVWRLALAPLDDAEFNRVVPARGLSIRGECLLQMREDRNLLLALDASLDAPAISADIDRAALWQNWEAIGKSWLRIADCLDDDAWRTDREIEVDGVLETLQTWQIVLHFIYSGTACRTRILRLVADLRQAVDFDLSLMQYLTGVYRR